MTNISEFDWRLCVICQLSTDEILQCPAESTRSDIGAGYKSFANNLVKFRDINNLPVKVNFNYFDEGRGVEDCFMIHKAKWHKSCRSKFGNDKLERALKRHNGDSAASQPSCKFTRFSLQTKHVIGTEVCFFCDESDNTGTLHAASTFGVDERVRECAMLLQDSKLLAKLSSGDMVAQEVKYHAKCLAALYNRSRAAQSKLTQENAESKRSGIAFAELVAYINEIRETASSPPVFKLNDLTRMFSSRLDQLNNNTDSPSYVHATRLVMSHTGSNGIKLVQRRAMNRVTSALFCICAPCEWNQLPLHVTSSKSVFMFKRLLFQFLLP
jgi:hypothetical protein